MTRPNRFILRMVLFLIVMTAIASPLAPGLWNAFQYNPGLNGLVLGIFVAGIFINFRQVLLLGPETSWLDGARRHQPPTSERLRLLAPLASMIGDGFDSVSLSAVTLRSLLDSISSRLDEQRDTGRYFVGLLIFLGLLGTFWGLSHAVGSMGEVIRSLSLSGGDANAAFEKLKSGMEAPLGGMGMAFSTSLFGLAGSLILGFLDLQAGQAQNAFYNELEEWLAGQTQLGTSISAAPPAQNLSSPAYLHALLERTAERLDEMAIVIDAGQKQTQEMTDTISLLTDYLRANQDQVGRLCENEMQLQPLLVRLIEETVKSREHIVTQLQGEFRLLARTLSAPKDVPPKPPEFLAPGR